MLRPLQRRNAITQDRRAHTHQNVHMQHSTTLRPSPSFTQSPSSTVTRTTHRSQRTADLMLPGAYKIACVPTKSATVTLINTLQCQTPSQQFIQTVLSYRLPSLTAPDAGGKQSKNHLRDPPPVKPNPAAYTGHPQHHFAIHRITVCAIIKVQR